MHIPKLFSYVNPFSTQVKNGWLCVVGKWAQKVCMCVCFTSSTSAYEKNTSESPSQCGYIYIYTCTPTPFFCFINVLGKHTFTHMIFIPFTHCIQFLSIFYFVRTIFILTIFAFTIFTPQVPQLKVVCYFVFSKIPFTVSCKWHPTKNQHNFNFKIPFIWVFGFCVYFSNSTVSPIFAYIYIYSSQCELFIYYKQSSIHNMAQDMKTSGKFVQYTTV